MSKYITVMADRGGSIARLDGDVATLVSPAEVLALLNSPPPAPPGGIVWRRPGEAGRVDGKPYLITRNWIDCWTQNWKLGRPNDGWGTHDIKGWAEITPPAWEGEKP